MKRGFAPVTIDDARRLTVKKEGIAGNFFQSPECVKFGGKSDPKSHANF